VFLAAADAALDPTEFAPAFIDALEFELLPGVPKAIAKLLDRGLALAVVSNWDCALPDHLARLDLPIDVVATSSEVGVPKPHPAVFELALQRLGVEPEHTLHVGDSPADEEGAHALGMRFAPAPLERVVTHW
jgi:putative hydrolase of the HAD superfamily